MISVMNERAKKTEPVPPPTKKRSRLAVDTTERVLRAVELRAIAMSVKARRQVSQYEAVNAILEESLAAELAEVDREAARKSRKES